MYMFAHFLVHKILKQQPTTFPFETFPSPLYIQKIAELFFSLTLDVWMCVCVCMLSSSHRAGFDVMCNHRSGYALAYHTFNQWLRKLTHTEKAIEKEIETGKVSKSTETEPCTIQRHQKHRCFYMPKVCNFHSNRRKFEIHIIWFERIHTNTHSSSSTHYESAMHSIKSTPQRHTHIRHSNISSIFIYSAFANANFHYIYSAPKYLQIQTHNYIELNQTICACTLSAKGFRGLSVRKKRIYNRILVRIYSKQAKEWQKHPFPQKKWTL